MKKIDRGKIFFILLLLGIAIVFSYISQSYAPKPRLIPLAVSIAAILIGLPIFANEIYSIKLISSFKFRLTDFSDKTVRTAAGRDSSFQRLIIILLWMSGFLILVFFLGFYIATIAFSFIYLKVQAKIGSLKASMISGALWFFIYVIFAKGMELFLFKGIFFGEILPPL
jgi:hypothetical protein